MSFHPLTVAILVVVILSLASRRKTGPSDPGVSEPPFVRASLWGFLRHGAQELDRLATKNMNKFPHGIFTIVIPIFGFWLYIVNSPYLTTLLQARSKYNGLGWIAVFLNANMGGMPKKTTDFLFKGTELGDVDTASGFVHDYHTAQLRALTLGSSLDSMRVGFSEAWQPLIEALKTSVEEGHSEVDIWEWIRKVVTISVGRGVWGPMSPYSTNPELWKEIWIFLGTFRFWTYKLESLFTPRYAVAREKLVDAFVEFGEKGGFETANSLPQGLAKVLEQNGLNNREVARMAISQSVALFDNPATVAYTLLSYILREKELLALTRTELEPLAKYDNLGRKSIDVYRVSEECPLLLSAFHEVLRIISVGVTIR